MSSRFCTTRPSCRRVRSPSPTCPKFPMTPRSQTFSVFILLASHEAADLGIRLLRPPPSLLSVPVPLSSLNVAGLHPAVSDLRCGSSPGCAGAVPRPLSCPTQDRPVGWAAVCVYSMPSQMMVTHPPFPLCKCIAIENTITASSEQRLTSLVSCISRWSRSGFRAIHETYLYYKYIPL